MNDAPTPVKLWCNACMQDTWHERVTGRDRQVEEQFTFEDGRPYPDTLLFTISSEVFACRGCEEVTVRRTESCPDFEHERVEFFPARRNRRMPLWLHRLPPNFRQLLQEVYVALQGSSRQLAAMRTRGLLDMLMDETVGNHGGFSERVERMRAAGHLTPKQIDVVLVTLDFGHAAAHRGYRPYELPLYDVMDIIEALLHSHFVQPELAEGLRKTVPQRPPRPPAVCAGPGAPP